MAKEGGGIVRGFAEGIGKEATSVGVEITKDIAGQGATAIKTRLFGIGKGDEAKFRLAEGRLKTDERRAITKFLEWLSNDEAECFRQTIAEMDPSKGGYVLKQMLELSDDPERKREAVAAGLIKPSTKTGIIEATKRELDSLSERIKKRIKKNREEPPGTTPFRIFPFSIRIPNRRKK